MLRSGNLGRAMRASIAIPGALPPVLYDGDLLCDGGTFNNFPVDVMRRMRGVGTVIGVDLNTRKPRQIDADEIPGSWALLRDRLRPRPPPSPVPIACGLPDERPDPLQRFAPACMRASSPTST